MVGWLARSRSFELRNKLAKFGPPTSIKNEPDIELEKIFNAMREKLL